MRYVLVFLIFLAIAAPSGRASQSPQASDSDWSQWQFLIGEWVGEGGGQPGQASSGGTSLSFDLEGRVLIRRNFSDYPATKDKPAISHRDLMVIYRDPESKSFRAMYWDNEGHVINYTAAFSSDGSVLTLISPPSNTAPRFRFIYRKEKGDRVGVEFDIAPPGKPDSFAKYAGGFMHKR